MPTIPAGPVIKSSGVDSKTAIRLVIDALISAQKTSTPPLLLLKPSGSNWLNQLYRDEVISTLKDILDKNQGLFAIIPNNCLQDAPKEAQTMLTGLHSEKQWWTKWQEAPEEAPILLGVSDAFDNWCEAQLHKESVTLANLSEANRKKVLRTVEAIYEQFELTSKPSVAIDWIPPSDSENAQARTMSLDFLVNKDVVRQYKFNYWMSGGEIAVEINIKQFMEIRADLLAYSQRQVQTVEEEKTTVTSTTSSGARRFPAIAGMGWADIHMKFVDGHNLRVTAKDSTEAFDYKQMGFEDARARKPNSQWTLLTVLAKRGGQLDWSNSEASENFRKKKQLLSKTLKAFFGIDDDPFHRYKDEKAYKTKFKLKAEGD